MIQSSISILKLWTNHYDTQEDQVGFEIPSRLGGTVCCADLHAESGVKRWDECGVFAVHKLRP
jgi:hypothetical protein